MWTLDSGSAPTLNTGYDNPALYKNDVLSCDNHFGLQVGVKSNESSRLDVNINTTLSGLIDLRLIGVSKNEGIIYEIDSAINNISCQQTELGAARNRLESALDEISIQYENLASSRSTIRDADIAEVSSTYIQQQILQQASATLMATANQSPAIALQLI